jgi:hypothetical protein
MRGRELGEGDRKAGAKTVSQGRNRGVGATRARRQMRRRENFVLVAQAENLHALIKKKMGLQDGPESSKTCKRENQLRRQS